MTNNQLGIFQNSKDSNTGPKGNKKARFSDWQILGHEAQIEYLKSNISQGDIAHAYLFTGEEQIGKKKVAVSFVKALLCKSDLKFCDKCASCTQVEKGIHPDVFILSGNEPIKIEEVRKLISTLNLKPFNSFYKIAVIDNAERLTLEAANALLKTLEEPPGQAVLILITRDSSILLKTIVSRLRIIKFFKLSNEIIEKILDSQNIAQNKKNLVLKVASGKPGRIFDLLSNPEEIEKLEHWFEEFLLLLNQDKATSLNYSFKLTKIYESEPEKVIKILNFWIIILRDLINFKVTANYKSFIKDHFKTEILEELDIYTVVDIINNINSAKEIISNPNSGFNIRLIIDLIVLKIGRLKVFR